MPKYLLVDSRKVLSCSELLSSNLINDLVCQGIEVDKALQVLKFESEAFDLKKESFGITVLDNAPHTHGMKRWFGF